MPIEEPVLPPLVEPLPVDEPLPIPPGVRVVLEAEPVEDPVPMLFDVPPAPLAEPWSRRQVSFSSPVSESQRVELLELEPAEELPDPIAPLPVEPPTLEPLEPPTLEPVDPPRVDPLEPPTLLPDAPPVLPPAPPPDCA